jgi:hypothetical protein
MKKRCQEEAGRNERRKEVTNYEGGDVRDKNQDLRLELAA